MKFATLILFGLVLSVFEPVKCLKEAQDNTESVDAGESATENTSSDEIITIVDSSNVSARNLAPKTCTCNDNVKNQNVPPTSAVQEDLTTPKEESTKTSKKTNANKKYRVITITLPDESEASAEIISGLGREASGQIVSSYIKDEVADVPKEEKVWMVDDEEKVANNDEKNADNLEQQQDATSIKKSKKESKSKADERTKKSGKYDNEKRSKRDTKGSSKGGRNKSKSNSKNKESKRGGNKNRK